MDVAKVSKLYWRLLPSEISQLVLFSTYVGTFAHEPSLWFLQASFNAKQGASSSMTSLIPVQWSWCKLQHTSRDEIDWAFCTNFVLQATNVQGLGMTTSGKPQTSLSEIKTNSFDYQFIWMGQLHSCSANRKQCLAVMPNTKPSKATVVIPCIRNLSESIKQVLTPLRFRTCFRLHRTLS